MLDADRSSAKGLAGEKAGRPAGFPRRGWRSLVEATGGIVQRMAARLRIDPHTAEDIHQEALRRLHRETRRGENVGNPHGWVVRTASLLMADHFRGRARTVGTGGGWRPVADVDISRLGARDGDPLQGAILRDLAAHRGTLLARLGQPHARIAELRIFHGLTNRQMWAYLQEWEPGTSWDTCRRLLRETTCRLRKLGRGEDHRDARPEEKVSA